MKKLTKLLALVLAAVLLLPAVAFAEGEEGSDPKELWLQWVDEKYTDEGDVYYEPNKDDRPHPEPNRQQTPGEENYWALFTSDNDGEKLTPVPADKLEGSEGVTIRPLCPDVKGKEHYVSVSVAEWNKEYTISYNGCTLTMESRLPDIALYRGPAAVTDTYLPWGEWVYSPTIENRPVYLIATCTDATHGRHLSSLALSEGGDSGSFQLRRIGDNIYKVTLTGDGNAPGYTLAVDVTWQDASFAGGRSHTDHWEYGVDAQVSLLVGNKPAPAVNPEKRTLYNDVKDTLSLSGKLTLKAGEAKTVYTALTGFTEKVGTWTVGPYSAYAGLGSSDSKLKLTVDSADPTKATVLCDVPGTYELTYIYPVVDAVYHEDGTKYTDEEFLKWDQDTSYGLRGGELVIITDRETGKGAPFEEVFPGQKIDYRAERGGWYYPIAVTVEPSESPFTDVKAEDWFAPAVNFVYSRGLMKGDSGRFDVEGKITGAEFAQILYNKEGRPAVAEGTSFQGVTGQWYAPAILWAASQGIITDSGETAVDPEKPLTRQQIALMLYNAMGKPEGSGDLSAFSDAGQISDWAKSAMTWAVGAKVFRGSGGKLTPADTATRPEVAQILMNYFG